VAAPGEGDDERRLDDRDEVDRLLGRLDPRSREIVRLRFYGGLTQDQIAEQVGISQMHVSRLLRRSFETMRAVAADDRPPGRAP
jgi:RNA polymerase sigma-B factor